MAKRRGMKGEASAGLKHELAVERTVIKLGCLLGIVMYKNVVLHMGDDSQFSSVDNRLKLRQTATEVGVIVMVDQPLNLRRFDA